MVPHLDLGKQSAPQATPNYPILGNALQYARNPPAYLVEQRRRHGGVFALNLAGFRSARCRRHHRLSRDDPDVTNSPRAPFYIAFQTMYRTVIVADPVTMRQVANAPETVLSARHAVADFGFQVRRT